MSDSLLAGSTTVVRLTGFQDDVSGQYPQDAAVTCDVLDATGTAVAGAGGIAMPYVAGTSAATTQYRGIIPATAALVAGQPYTRRITAVGANGTGTRVFTKEIVATLE